MAPTQLDYGQVIKNAYDETTNRLRVDAQATITFPPDVAIQIDHTTDSVRLGNGTTFFTSTTSGGKVGLDVSIINGGITGTFSQSGLSTAIKESVVIVTDVPTKLPPTALSNRNTMSIKVLGVNPIYVGSSSVTASNGYVKNQNEELFVDIKDNASVWLYAVCDTGMTSEVRILEFA